MFRCQLVPQGGRHLASSSRKNGINLWKKRHVLIWPQAAVSVRASQQKSPQEWRATKRAGWLDGWRSRLLSLFCRWREATAFLKLSTSKGFPSWHVSQTLPDFWTLHRNTHPPVAVPPSPPPTRFASWQGRGTAAQPQKCPLRPWNWRGPWCTQFQREDQAGEREHVFSLLPIEGSCREQAAKEGQVRGQVSCGTWRANLKFSSLMQDLSIAFWEWSKP